MVEDLESAATQHFPYKTALSQMLLKDTPLPLSEAATSRQPALMQVSSVPGKSFLAMTTATVLSEDSSKPVRLIECNSEYPSLSDVMIADACTQLKDLPVHGLILNQVASRIPAWLVKYCS